MRRRQRSRLPGARSNVADVPKDDVLRSVDAHRDVVPDDGLLLVGAVPAGPHLVGGCLHVAHAVRAAQ
ncbi:hypothetical protein V1291_005069 [Nitrobacteraceae bacterium AZCC 1564]